MKSLNFHSRKSDVFKFIESIEDLDISNECNGEIITNLFGGKYDKKGFFGRVIVKDSKAYKLNMISREPGLHNAVLDDLVQMDKILLQSIFAGILDSILGATHPEDPHGAIYLMSRYPKTYDIIKCDNGIVSIYEECNLGTIKDFISDNIHDLDFLDKELVRCIKQMSEIVGFLHKNFDFHHSDLTIVNVMAHQGADAIEYKMIDFDSVSIELENFNLSKIPHSRVPEDNPEFKKTFHGSTFYSITPLGLEPFKEAFLFKTTQIRTINIDIYTLILTIIFNKDISASLEDLPIFSDFCSKIFSEADLEKMSKFLENRKQPKSDLFAVLGYIISRRLRLREDIYDVIREFDSLDL
jgi:hypothetical protein